jgi:hypothetical protein
MCAQGFTAAAATLRAAISQQTNTQNANGNKTTKTPEILMKSHLDGWTEPGPGQVPVEHRIELYRRRLPPRVHLYVRSATMRSTSQASMKIFFEPRHGSCAPGLMTAASGILLGACAINNKKTHKTLLITKHPKKNEETQKKHTWTG